MDLFHLIPNFRGFPNVYSYLYIQLCCTETLTYLSSDVVLDMVYPRFARLPKDFLIICMPSYLLAIIHTRGGYSNSCCYDSLPIICYVGSIGHHITVDNMMKEPSHPLFLRVFAVRGYHNSPEIICTLICKAFPHFFGLNVLPLCTSRGSIHSTCPSWIATPTGSLRHPNRTRGSSPSFYRFPSLQSGHSFRY